MAINLITYDDRFALHRIEQELGTEIRPIPRVSQCIKCVVDVMTSKGYWSEFSLGFLVIRYTRSLLLTLSQFNNRYSGQYRPVYLWWCLNLFIPRTSTKHSMLPNSTKRRSRRSVKPKIQDFQTQDSTPPPPLFFSLFKSHWKRSQKANSFLNLSPADGFWFKIPCFRCQKPMWLNTLKISPMPMGPCSFSRFIQKSLSPTQNLTSWGPYKSKNGPTIVMDVWYF